jgi:hypothetical protein
MKKIILTTAISTALIASSVYAAGPATSGLVLSGEGSYSVITDTYDANGVKTSSSTGFGLGGYVGYDYAITDHVTIGAKTGFYHSFGLGKGSLGGNTMKATTNNIPLLLNSKYYFNSGLYLGGETGVNFQKIHYSNNLTIEENNANSNWNAQYVIGGLVGYQINENVSIDGSLDYMTGNPMYKGQDFAAANKNNALANVKFGLAVNYKLPM